MDLPDGLTTRPLDARRRPRRLRGDGRPGAGRHRHGRDRGGRHRRRLGAAQLRPLRLARSASSTATGWWGTPRSPAPDRGDAAVDPGHRGRGIGTALALWMQDAARAARRHGDRHAGPGGLAGRPAARASSATGCGGPAGCSSCRPAPRSSSGRCPTGTPCARPSPRSTPPSTTVVEDAFLEWSVREREPYDDFLAEVIGRPGLRAVAAPGRHRRRRRGRRRGPRVRWRSPRTAGRPEAYVARLAVRRDQRHRGLAQALMVDAFARGPRPRRRSRRASRPTPAPARSASTRRSAWRSPRSGSTGRSTSEVRPGGPGRSPAGTARSRRPPRPARRRSRRSAARGGARGCTRRRSR